MAKEAEAHAEEDKAKKEAVEARNILDGAVYQAEKLKKDNEDKLSDEDKKTLDEAVESCQESRRRRKGRQGHARDRRQGT